MRFNNPRLLKALDATVTQVSSALDASQLYTGSIQATFTANDAAGTLILQGSNDPIELLPAGEAPQNWDLVPTATKTVSSGAIATITVAQLNYRWLRVKWTPSGGSAGTISCNGMFFGF